MLENRNRNSRWWLSLACAAAMTGCSQSRMALNESPSGPMPDRTSISVPGTADIAQSQEMRHPATVHIAYGRWQEQQKQFPQARESYQRALQYEPRSAEALLGLSRLDRLAGRITEAEEHLKRAEKLRPNDPLVIAGWAEFYASTGNYHQAIGKYREAITLAPNELVFKHQLAIALTKGGDITGGYEAFASIVGPAEAHYNVGYLLQQQGELAAAESEFQQALAINPKLVPATAMLAKVQRQRGLPTDVANGPARQQLARTNPSESASITTAGATAADEGFDTVQTLWTSQQPPSSSGQAQAPQAPAGLTPQQLEQWKNQQHLEP
ncbi:tetratricopeptide repeat protein [bacterium]|nr:tetratricopeptide repeat protein [bacterium]